MGGESEGLRRKSQYQSSANSVPNSLRLKERWDVICIARFVRFFFVENSMAQFLIKDFPDELLKAAKSRAMEEGTALQHLIVRAIRQYLRGKKEEGK
jgi:hypothetical protein